jgi:hypothetical protein
MKGFDDALKQKRLVHQALIKRMKEEVAALSDTLRSIQFSANNETKSTAGDKYETGRAMAQLEIEKIAGLLREKEKSLMVVSGLSVDPMTHIGPGALVQTSMGWFYISVNGGEVPATLGTIRCISPASPLAMAMRGKKPGDGFQLMHNDHTIEAII